MTTTTIGFGIFGNQSALENLARPAAKQPAPQGPTPGRPARDAAGNAEISAQQKALGQRALKILVPLEQPAITPVGTLEVLRRVFAGTSYIG